MEMCSSLWERAGKALESIPNPKEELSSFVDKMTQLDEKVSDFLLPQIQEVSEPAKRFFQKMRSESKEEWVDEAEEKVEVTKKAVEELNSCLQKVKDLMDTFQSKTNTTWTRSRPQATSPEWRRKYSTTDNPPPSDNDPPEVWYTWLTCKFTTILEFIKDEVMPPLIVYTALPASLVLIVTVLCPAVGVTAPLVLKGFVAGVCGLYSLNKVLPSLINLLKDAQRGKGAVASTSNSSGIDKLKNFMSSLHGDDN
ncbi:uncharacterized protein LOC132194270 [Neocloeon triangulifer]|uniref:uncharacterized protein LOC132194270 n=1 Tax=Neocloeon triangulifer TaxID=2078957 RepID=UPI00286EEC20|nr:uncharacterized protein LOC132194270 [Neocloeon triangulifer]